MKKIKKLNIPKWNIKPMQPMKPMIDSDNDGVPNWKDCQPFNPYKQDKNKSKERNVKLYCIAEDEYGNVRRGSLDIPISMIKKDPKKVANVLMDQALMGDRFGKKSLKEYLAGDRYAIDDSIDSYNRTMLQTKHATPVGGECFGGIGPTKEIAKKMYTKMLGKYGLLGKEEEW